MTKNKKISTNKTSNNRDKFAKTGWTLGIVGIATSILILGGFVAAIGIVFSSLGLASRNTDLKAKAKTGLILSIVGAVVAVIAFTVVFTILYYYALENGGYWSDYLSPINWPMC